MGKYIAIAGNIGAGKTTLTNMLAKYYCWEPKNESVEDNPYIEDFYKDMKRWSYELQIYFLNRRLRDIEKISESNNTIIQDRCVFEDRYIFAPTLYEQGNIEERDFQTYKELFDFTIKFIKKPDLLIYIKSTIGNLVSQIEKRDRGCENTMSIEYLSNLNKKYNEWIDNYDGKLLIIDGDTCKFENNQESFKQVIKQINEKLNN